MTWIVLAGISALSAAFVTIFGKIGLSGVDPSLATTIQGVLMAFILLVVSTLQGSFHTLGTVSGKAMMFIVLSACAGALSWLTYFWALKSGSASGVAGIDRLSIVFIVLLSALILGERLSWMSILGALLVIGGVILISLSRP